jgi:hypothetical protein
VVMAVVLNHVALDSKISVAPAIGLDMW